MRNLYAFKILFVPILYDLGCMWVLGVHCDVYKIAYLWLAIVDRIKLSSINVKCEYYPF